MDFQRARSDEQREVRRRVILETAAAMLAEMPVAQLSLNELSRRVSLAKSNVLRYFESREAVLLELLDAEFRDWVAAVNAQAATVDGDMRARGDALAGALARTLAERPVLCDLVSAQAAVLERNISTEVAVKHKRATNETLRPLVTLFQRVLPELDLDQAYSVLVVTLFMTSAAWPHSRPSEALIAAYATDPALAARRLEFVDVVDSTVATTISGVLARRPR